MWRTVPTLLCYRECTRTLSKYKVQAIRRKPVVVIFSRRWPTLNCKSSVTAKRLRSNIAALLSTMTNILVVVVITSSRSTERRLFLKMERVSATLAPVCFMYKHSEWSQTERVSLDEAVRYVRGNAMQSGEGRQKRMVDEFHHWVSITLQHGRGEWPELREQRAGSYTNLVSNTILPKMVFTLMPMIDLTSNTATMSFCRKWPKSSQ